MRTVYHQQMADLATRLGQMCGQAGAAMKSATRALLEADAHAADEVIGGHKQMVTMCAQAEKAAFDLLALQQPVAGDLRAIFSAVQVAADTERMDALAVHVAKIARRASPGQVLPEEVRGCFADMAKVALAMSESAKQALITRDPQHAAQLHQQDDAMDELYRHLFRVVLDDGWQYGASVAVETALLGRFYERFADHAVEVGRRVIFIVTGTLPAEDDISTF